MYRDYDDIINTLEHARKIMVERPELGELDKEDVLEVLDDGSREMCGYRWGVVAYMYVGELKDFSLPAIIEQLKDIKSGILTYEYIGFILQNEYDVNLVELLLVAAKMGFYNKILPFVKRNLSFEKTFATEKIDEFLAAYYANDTEKQYKQVLSNYAGLIVDFDAERDLCQKVIDTQNEEYYDLVLCVCHKLCEKDYKIVDELMENFLTVESVVCKKLAIEFAYRSLRCCGEAFEHNYEKWDSFLTESENYWEMLIPVYTEYVQEYFSGAVYEAVLNKLKTVIHGSVEQKRAFILEIQFNDSMTCDVVQILDEMLKESFEKDGQILNALDWILYQTLTHGEIQEVLEKMQLIFSVNGYKYDWKEFFDIFDSTQGELKKNQTIILEEVIKKISRGDENEFYFAIGLFDECIAGDDFRKNMGDKKYSEEVLELVLLGLLYNVLEAKKVCVAAFQMSGLLEENRTKYIEVCQEELYANYPYTMNEYAGQNISSENSNVRELAKKIVEIHKKRLEHVESGADILDLRPSAKRMETYRQAMWEQRKRIDRLSDEQSVFAKLFPKNIMKYGKRNAFIQVGRRNEWSFQVSDYAAVHYEVELPQEFMKDQLLLSEKRHRYMERRKQYAVNH